MQENYVSVEAWAAMPRKPMNGYLLFKNFVLDSVKQANPEKTSTEITAQISSMWTNLEEEKKLVYLIEYDKAWKKYKDQYRYWLDQYHLREEKVANFIKEKKERNRKRMKGSKKVTKAEKNENEDEEEEQIKE